MPAAAFAAMRHPTLRIQTLEAFQPLIARQGEQNTAHRLSLYHELLDAIATHCVANRPDRYEPRLKRGTPKTSPTCENPALRSNVKWLKGLPSFKCHSTM
jgi:hypothetical protein